MRRRGRSPTERLKTTNGITLSGGDEARGVDDAIDAIPLDTNDQDDLIRTIQAEAFKQHHLFQNAFAAVCGLAMLISMVVYPFLCHKECSERILSCWTHAIASSGTHALSVVLSRSLNHPNQSLGPDSGNDEGGYDPPPRYNAFWKTPLFGGTLSVHVLPIILLVTGVFDQDVRHYHLGLVLGNVVTMLGASLLLWDVESTRQAIDDLHKAKYEHKSL